MSEKTLTATDLLVNRLESARARERTARAEAARIKREMAAANRRLETQRLCTLGRAWIALAEREHRFRESGIRFLVGYINRETDRAALAGTPWAVPEPTPVEGSGNE